MKFFKTFSKLSSIVLLLKTTSGASIPCQVNVSEPNFTFETALEDVNVISNSISDSLYNNIYRYAFYSALSYCMTKDSSDLGDLQNSCQYTLCTDSYENIFVESVYQGKVSAILLRNDDNKEIILALKGTTTATEWFIDFQIFPMSYHFLSSRKRFWERWFSTNKECKGCKIHRGFYNSAKEIYKNIFSQIIELSDNYPDYRLVVTGHSLGGALAPIIANELLLLDKQTTVTTFGSPKLGNKIFAQWMDEFWNTENFDDDTGSAYFRVNHKGDIVPFLPFRQMGFEHCGVNLYINKRKLPMVEDDFEIRSNLLEVLSDNAIVSTCDDVTISKNNIDSILGSHDAYLFRMNNCVT